MIIKDCPFCTPEHLDSGGGCCFCDYSGKIAIGYGMVFSNELQYKQVVNQILEDQKEQEIIIEIF